MRKRKIMSSTPAYDERMDERFNAEIPDEFEIYDRIGKAYCKVADYKMIGSNAALVTIGVLSYDTYFGADEYIERGLEEFFGDMFNGSDYYFVVDEIFSGLPKYIDEYDIIGDADYSESYETYTVNVKITSSEHDDFADDAYFSASRKIGKKPIKSSYNPYGTDFKWYDEPIVMYIDGENSTFRKYTGNYKGNIVVVQPEYNERTDILSWVVYLNNRKLESFETSYDALDFAQFELVDMYITPIRSSKRVPKRKIVSAIDLRRKQDFVDAYMDAYGVTKTEAFKAFKDCVNRGDESYIDEIISGFNGNSRKSFYED